MFRAVPAICVRMAVFIGPIELMSHSDQNEYRLSFTTGGLFWSESAVLVKLYIEQPDWVALREQVVSHDLLQVRTRAASMRISREIIARLKEFNAQELEYFREATTQEQLWLLWIVICRHFDLVREFAVEVLRENYLTLKNTVDHRDFDAFFNRKAQFSDEVESLKESTRRKLRQNLFRMMREADLLTESDLIIPPILTGRFINLVATKDIRDLEVFPVSDADIAKWRG